MSETVAALDCGTNTLRLLIASADEAGKLIELDRQLRFAGLGQGVDATGQFADEAMTRGWKIIDEYVVVMREFGCQKARFVATSAARDAANRQVFFDGVQDRLGIEAELISGEEEARLSFTGTLSGARIEGAPVLMMDSGGGSTELVRGGVDGVIEQAVSLNIGSRRIRERFLHDDPPTASQIDQARAFINQMLDTCPVKLNDITTFVGVAGTVTTMTALSLGLASYQRDKVDGASMTPTKIADLADQLLHMSVDETRALGPVAPERAKVLCGGALIVSEVSKRVPVNLQASESDILNGVALSILFDGLGQRFR